MLADVLAYLYPAAVSLRDFEVADAGSGPFIARWNESLGPLPTTQQLADAQASAGFQIWLAEHGGNAAATARLVAKGCLQGALVPPSMVDRVLAEATRDEINVLRQWLTSFKAAMAGAGTFAAFKTAVATLPNLPDRTKAQLRTAAENKLSAGDVDN